MFELIKAEVAYKKWEYITFLCLPFLLIGMIWSIPMINDSDGMDFKTSVLFGFGTVLLLICMGLPYGIHKTSMEENRIHLLATFPVSLRAIAMSQSLPILGSIGLVSLLGFLLLGVIGLEDGDLHHIFVFNCVLLTLAFGFHGLFLQELFLLLPKYSSLVLWVLLFGLLVLNGNKENLFGIDVKLWDPDYLKQWWASIVLIFVSLIGFLGHMILFTKMRDDFSIRRRYP